MAWTGEISIPRDISRTPTSFCIFPSRKQIFQSSQHHKGAWDKGDSHPAPRDRRGPCGPVVACVPRYEESKLPLLAMPYICITHLLSWNKTINITEMEHVFPIRHFCPCVCPSSNHTSLHETTVQQLLSNCWESGQTRTKTDSLCWIPLHLPITRWVAFT